MVVTTLCDIKQDYEIIGLVVVRSKFGIIGQIEKNLRKQAEELKADAIIGLKMEISTGTIIAYGTAVKFKK